MNKIRILSSRSLVVSVIICVMIVACGCASTRDGDPSSIKSAKAAGAFIENQGAFSEYKAEHANITILENREGELVFSASMDDYIEGYNLFYWMDHRGTYLLPQEKWDSQIMNEGIHSDHDTIHYNFTEDETTWSLPTVSVYVPTNADYIQEVTLNFDWHSYSENLYQMYEEMCLYTLKVFLPELSDEKIIDLYSESIDLGYENAFPAGEVYGKGTVPYALHYSGNVAVYSHHAMGSWQRLCIIPTTEDLINDFERQGTIIYEIE